MSDDRIQKLEARIIQLEADCCHHRTAAYEREQQTRRTIRALALKSLPAFLALEFHERRRALQEGTTTDVIDIVSQLSSEDFASVFDFLRRDVVVGLEQRVAIENGLDPVYRLSMDSGSSWTRSFVSVSVGERDALIAVGLEAFIEPRQQQDGTYRYTPYDFATRSEHDLRTPVYFVPGPRLEVVRRIDRALDNSIRQGVVRCEEASEEVRVQHWNWKNTVRDDYSFAAVQAYRQS